MIQKGPHHVSKRRHRSSKSSASSVSLTSTEQEDYGDYRGHQGASPPMTQERSHKEGSISRGSKPDSPHIVGGNSLQRSHFFGSGRKDKGY